MNNHLTDITLVVDRSGSMDSIRQDAEGGINSFIRPQANQPDESLVTLVEFDTEYDFVMQGIPAQQAPEYRLQPRGMTALLDAVGRAIGETAARIDKMRPEDRPGLVICVIMTDGMENASREFTRDQIRKLIASKEQADWQFTFLGANQDAFEESQEMGMQQGDAADFVAGKVAQAWSGTADKVARMRAQKKRGMQVDNKFTDEEREQMK